MGVLMAVLNYNDQHYLIQAKRYTGHIKANDIKVFAEICNRRKGKGIFVHTGKTGNTARKAARECGVEVVSGEKLLELLLSDPPEPKRTVKLTKIANKAFSD